MNLALLSLLSLTLLLCGAVASLPAVTRRVEPRSTAPAAAVQNLWVVQGADQRWYLSGAPIERAELGARLQRRRGGELVRFLPSSALTLAQVTASLSWLRRQGAGAVLLEMRFRP